MAVFVYGLQQMQSRCELHPIFAQSPSGCLLHDKLRNKSPGGSRSARTRCGCFKENENDQGVLNNLRDLEILGVRVPLKPTPKGAKKPSSTLQHSNDKPKTLLPAPLMSAKATPKAATPEPSLPRGKRLYQDLILSPKWPRNIQDDAPLERNTSNKEDEPGKVTILAKVASFQPEIFAACRPIAVGEPSICREG